VIDLYNENTVFSVRKEINFYMSWFILIFVVQFTRGRYFWNITSLPIRPLVRPVGSVLPVQKRECGWRVSEFQIHVSSDFVLGCFLLVLRRARVARRICRWLLTVTACYRDLHSAHCFLLLFHGTCRIVYGSTLHRIFVRIHPALTFPYVIFKTAPIIHLTWG
jgi:hypothetical protein